MSFIINFLIFITIFLFINIFVDLNKYKVINKLIDEEKLLILNIYKKIPYQRQFIE